MADSHESVLELSTWDWFTEQIACLRPLDAIETDIKLAIKSAGKCKNIILLARLTLIGAAVRQRLQIIDDYYISELLIKCGKPGLAIEHLRDGNRLRVNNKFALQASIDLFENGFKQEALNIFNLSEPYEYFSGEPISDNHISQNELYDLLKTWVNSSIKLRNVNEVIETICRIKINPTINSKKSIENESKSFKENLLFEGALACCRFNEWYKWKLFYEQILNGNNNILIMFTRLRSLSFAYEQDNTDFINEHYSEFIAAYPLNFFMNIKNKYLQNEGRISFAELLLNFPDNKQLAYQLINDIAPIPLFDSELGYDEKPLQHEKRFRFAKLYFRLEQNPVAEDVLLDKAEKSTDFTFLDSDQIYMYRLVARATYIAAKLWALGNSGDYLSPKTFLNETKWILDTFGANWDGITLRAKTSIAETRFGVLDCVIAAAVQHGVLALNSLKDDFTRRWTDSIEGRKWWTGLQRKIIDSFSVSGIEETWSRIQLNRISVNMMDGLDPYGRAEERKAQADSWILINEKGNGFNELCLLGNSARGILSEKDYQLSEWIRWLKYSEDTVNKQEQKDRILKMFKLIINGKGTASGISHASEELLEVAFNLDPNISINLFKIMLEQNFISYESGVIQLLKSAINSPKPPYEEIKQILVNLVFPFTVNSEPDLLESLITSKYHKSDFVQTRDLAQFLIDNIGIIVISKNRANWTQGVLKGIEKVGISKDQLNINTELLVAKYEDTSQVDRRLFLKDNLILTNDDAVALIKNIGDFEDLISKQDKSKSEYFEWIYLIEKTVSLIENETQIKRLDSIISNKFSTNIFKDRIMGKYKIAISKWHQKKGNNEFAWEQAKLALDSSQTSGWIRHWDGGVKLDILRQLQNLDSFRTRDFIYDLYVSDLTEISYYPESYIISLYDILITIDINFPKHEIWLEVEKYLDDLFINTKITINEAQESSLLSSEKYLEDNSPQSAMICFLLSFLTYPSYIVAQGAIKGLASLSIDNKLLLNTMNRALSSDDDLFVERVLIVIDIFCLDEIHFKKLLFFNENLHILARSNNFSIRLLSSKILSKINSNEPGLFIKNNDLPAIYQIQLIQDSLFNTLNINKSIPNQNIIGDPAIVIRPLDIELRQIAEMTNLEVKNVMYRAKQFFDSFITNHKWLPDYKIIADKNLLAFLENTGMYVAHYKPHIFAAKLALSYLIAELWDCNYFQLEDIYIIEHMLRVCDVNLYNFNPSFRPKYIKSMSDQNDNDSYEKFTDKWVDESYNSLCKLFENTDEGLIILGEKTELKYLQQEWPSELRYSFVQPEKINEQIIDKKLEKGQFPSYRTIKNLWSQYNHIDSPYNSIIIANEPNGIENSGGNWIALNPVLANNLGWKLSPNDLFTWLNILGDVVVRSVWWRDGCIDLHHRFARVEVGEGWLVLATNSGWQDIYAYYNKLSRLKIISRKMGFLGNKATAFAKEVIALK